MSPISSYVNESHILLIQEVSEQVEKKIRVSSRDETQVRHLVIVLS
jgi:hypothetical protein